MMTFSHISSKIKAMVYSFLISILAYNLFFFRWLNARCECLQRLDINSFLSFVHNVPKPCFICDNWCFLVHYYYLVFIWLKIWNVQRSYSFIVYGLPEFRASFWDTIFGSIIAVYNLQCAECRVKIKSDLKKKSKTHIKSSSK